jgi:hypothetical protein
VGIVALVLVGGCAAMLVLGSLVVGTAAKDPQLQKAIQSLPNNSDVSITLAKFGQVQQGMTYEQVKAILGKDGTMDSENNIAGIYNAMYSWRNSDYSGMNAMFQNGKLFQKSQIALK